MKTVSKDKQIMINMTASLVSTLVSIFVSFVLGRTVLAESFDSFGFVGIANDFVTYANIVAMALNSMAGRFITVSLTKGDYEAANKYFNSILYANLAIIGILFIPCALVVMFLEHFMNISSAALVPDIKLLFALTFLNFMVTIVSTTFSTATFAANRLDLQAFRTIESQLLRAVILIAAFNLLPVRVSYFGLAALAATIYMFLSYIHYTKKLLPQIEISRRHFSFSSVLEILSAGIWNTIMRGGQVLTNSLDTLITNLFIGETMTTCIYVSKMLANQINALYETIAAVFTPSLTISFAKDSKKELLEDLTSAMKMTGFFANIPLCFVVAFGLSFYRLWLPGAQGITDHSLILTIYILTVLTMFGTIVGGVISPLFNIYTVVNKLKWNSLVTLFMGIASIVIVFILLSTTDLSVYAIAGTSTILGIFKNLTFTPMYAAHCLGIPKRSFYPTILRYVLVSISMGALFCGLHWILPSESWLWLFINLVICGVIGTAVNIIFLFGKKERAMLIEIIKKFGK